MKYYVSCGEERIVTASSPRKAAIEFFKRIEGAGLSNRIKVSERGFAEHDDDIWFNTGEIVLAMYEDANAADDEEEDSTVY